MDAKISVIVPGYNCEKYLAECLDSLLSQTHDNLEIIFVDDGSTDSTLEIARVYERQDSRVRVMHFRNHGQGYARNRALEAATGEFVGYLDSDDTLEPTAMESALRRLETDGSDFVVFTFKYFSDGSSNFRFNHSERYFGSFYLEGPDRFRTLDARAYFAHNHLFRRSFLVENGVFFSEGHLYEDNPFVLKATLCSERISLIQAPLENIRSNPDSSTRTNFDKSVHADDYILAVEECVNMLSEYEELVGIEQARYFYTKYALKKFFRYYYARIPRNVRSTFARRFLRAISPVARSLPPNVRDRELYLCLKTGVFDHGTPLALEALAFGRCRVLPRYRSLRKALRAFRARVDSPYDYRGPIQNDLVLFMGFDFRYTGNSRYLFEELLASSNASSPQIRFVTSSKLVAPQLRIEPDSPDMFDALSRAHIVIVESWVKRKYEKRPGAIWIQLWHGSPLKRMLFDSPESAILPSSPKTKNIHYADISKWDYFLVDEQRFARIFQTAFLLDPTKMIVDRYPRVRYLLQASRNPDTMANLRDKYRVPEGKRVVLYCPTWRDYNYAVPQDKVDSSYLIDLDLLQNLLGQDYCILSKDHSYLHSASNPLSTMPDAETQELLLVSDILVTDYSSIVFDAMAIGMPYALFCNDFARFAKIRGVYEDVWEELSGNAFTSERDLADSIISQCATRRLPPSLPDIDEGDSALSGLIERLVESGHDGDAYV